MDITDEFAEAVAAIERLRAEGKAIDFPTIIAELGLDSDEEYQLKQALVHVLDQMGRNGGAYIPHNPIVYASADSVPVPVAGAELTRLADRSPVGTGVTPIRSDTRD